MDPTSAPTQQRSQARTTLSVEPTTAHTIVLGAGFGGLAAAKTYLQLQPHLSTLRAESPNKDRSHELQYDHDLLILDSAPQIGGVWSRSRLYPGLEAQSPNGLFEYSERDITMVDDATGHGKYTSLLGTWVADYLERYAEKFHLRERFRGGVTVTRIERRLDQGQTIRGNEGWLLHANNNEVFACDKLLVCAGLYNNPFLPLSAAQTQSYQGLSIHSKDMGSLASSLTTDPSIKNVLIVGGNKSSIEACGLFLAGNRSRLAGQGEIGENSEPDTRNIKVHWTIRPAEKGVLLLLVRIADGMGSAEGALSRAFAALHPTVFDTNSSIYRFLHSGKSWLGAALVGIFWWLFTAGIRWAAGYGKSENARRLKPEIWGTTEWEFAGLVQIDPGHEVLKVLNEEGRAKEVKTKNGLEIEVLRSTVKRLQGREAVIVDRDGHEKTVPADAVIWCTGWLPSADFFDAEEARRVGTPVAYAGLDDRSSNRDKKSTDSVFTTKPSISEPSQQPADPLISTEPNPSKPSTQLPYLNETQLASLALKHTLNLYPRLHHSPHLQHLNDTQPLPTPPKHTPYNLFRHIVSPWCLAHADRSIAFVNMTATAATPAVAELSALWAVSWLEGLLEPESLLGADDAANLVMQQQQQQQQAGEHGEEGPVALETKAFPRPKNADGDGDGDGDVATILAHAQWQTALQNTFMHLRWGTRQSRDPDVLLDVQGYLDQMCRDLGVRVDRKRWAMELDLQRRVEDGKGEVHWKQRLKAWRREWFEAYTSKDYEGVVDEFVELRLRSRARRGGEVEGKREVNRTDL